MCDTEFRENIIKRSKEKLSADFITLSLIDNRHKMKMVSGKIDRKVKPRWS